MVRAIPFIVAVGSLLVSVGSAQAAWPEGAVGRVLSVRGVVLLHADGDLTATAQPLDRGGYVQEGSIVKTAGGSAARLAMRDRSILDLGPSTQLTVKTYRAKPRTKRRVGLQLFAGRVWARVNKWFGTDSEYEVHTGAAVAGVRGTELVVDVAPDGVTRVTCVNGSVEVLSRLAKSTVMLGPLDQVGVEIDGVVTRARVTAAQIGQMSQAVQSSSSVDPESAGNQLQDSGVQPESGSSGSSEGQEQLDDLGGNEQQAPLDLEPGSGKARIKGRIELKETP